MWLHTYIGTIAGTWLMGIPCVHTYVHIYIDIYIPFDILGAIYWLPRTSIDTVQN